eukprot:PhM_4_TR6682/c0_g1_i1/m.20310
MTSASPAYNFRVFIESVKGIPANAVSSAGGMVLVCKLSNRFHDKSEPFTPDGNMLTTFRHTIRFTSAIDLNEARENYLHISVCAAKTMKVLGHVVVNLATHAANSKRAARMRATLPLSDCANADGRLVMAIECIEDTAPLPSPSPAPVIAQEPVEGKPPLTPPAAAVQPTSRSVSATSQVVVEAQRPSVSLSMPRVAPAEEPQPQPPVQGRQRATALSATGRGGGEGNQRGSQMLDIAFERSVDEVIPAGPPRRPRSVSQASSNASRGTPLVPPKGCARCRDLEEEVERLQRAVRSMESEAWHTGQKCNHDVEIRRLEVELDTVRKREAAFADEVQVMEMALTAAKDRNQQLEEEIEKRDIADQQMTAALAVGEETKEKVVKTARDAVGCLQEQLRRYLLEVQRVTQSEALVKQQLDDARAEIGELRQQNIQLQTHCEEVMEKNDVLRARVHERKLRIDELKGMLSVHMMLKSERVNAAAAEQDRENEVYTAASRLPGTFSPMPRVLAEVVSSKKKQAQQTPRRTSSSSQPPPPASSSQPQHRHRGYSLGSDEVDMDLL